MNPGYPDPLGGGAAQEVLPPSKYQLAGDLVFPKRVLGLVALTQQVSQTFGLNLSYSHTNGWDRYRGRNINAPLDGVRPEPSLGNITQVESTAKLRVDSMTAGLNFNIPQRRTFLFANYAVQPPAERCGRRLQPAREQLRPGGGVGAGRGRTAAHRERGHEHERHEERAPRRVAPRRARARLTT